MADDARSQEVFRQMIQNIRNRTRNLTDQTSYERRILQPILRRMVNQAKLNMRRANPPIIDTGALSNSLRFEIQRRRNKLEVNIGSFDKPYARINEFGGPVGDAQIRAMFANLRGRTREPGRSKVLTITRDPQSGFFSGIWKPRPYLVPAVNQYREQLITALADLVRRERGDR